MASAQDDDADRPILGAEQAVPTAASPVITSMFHGNGDANDEIIGITINRIPSRFGSMSDSTNHKNGINDQNDYLESSGGTPSSLVHDGSRSSGADDMNATPRPPSFDAKQPVRRRVRKQSHRRLRWSSRDKLHSEGQSKETLMNGVTYGGTYGRSVSSCSRHLRLSSASSSNNNNNNSKRKNNNFHRYDDHSTSLLTTTTMSTPTMVTKGGGLALSFLAFRDKYTEEAVREARAQVLMADHSTSRQEFALSLSKRRYKRLEADMIRSRLELTDALGIIETERIEHADKLRNSERRRAELEGAVRAADEVVEQLTAEARHQRRTAFEREAFLAACLESAEKKAEQRGRDYRREKLSTWSTIAREADRAAGRERYRMTAFLQRYIVENEHLRASIREAEAETSRLRERLQQSEESHARVTPSQGANDPHNGAEHRRLLAVTRRFMVGGGGAAGSDGRQIVADSGQRERGRAPDAEDTSTITAAELAAQRLKERFWRQYSDPLKLVEAGCDSGGSRLNGGSARKEGARARGQLRTARGRLAELSHLLAATEDERDSMASLLILAERQMERMAIQQEEEAMAVAWKKAAEEECWGRGQVRARVGRGGRQPQQQATLDTLEPDGIAVESTGVAGTSKNSIAKSVDATTYRATTVERRSDVPADQTASGAGSAAPGLCGRRASANDGGNGGTKEVENFDLRKQVRDLEALLRAAQIEHQESEREGQRSLFSSIGNTTVSREPEGSTTTTRQARYLVAAGTSATANNTDEATLLVEDDRRDEPKLDDDTAGGHGKHWRRHHLGSDEDGMIRGQLAWVLGLPPDRAMTDHELLAEVMHLVVTRGDARTDADTLEKQLVKIDDAHKLLYRSRLATVAAITAAASGTDAGGNIAADTSLIYLQNEGLPQDMLQMLGGSVTGRLQYTNRPGSRVSSSRREPHGPGGGGISGGPDNFRGTVGVSEGENGGNLVGKKTTRSGERFSRKSPASRSLQENEAVAKNDRSMTESVTAPKGKPPNDGEDDPAGRKRATEISGRSDPTRGAGIAAMSTARHRGSTDDFLADSSLAAGAGSLPSTKPEEIGNATTPTATAAPGARDVAEGDSQRASFPRTLQGRVVSIDIFCTKVRQKQKLKEGDDGSEEELPRKGGLLGDDEEYQIRVEAYDPTVLKHHMLMVYEDDIKRCFKSHPHLYTLGPHRRRVHQSLAERLTFMSEDDVRAQLDKKAGRQDNELQAAPPASAGSTGLPGGRGSAGPAQLLVLLGDAGEVILAEKNPNDPDAGDTKYRHVHRFAKSAILQIEKEEEVVEGVVFQYEAPLHEAADPVAAELAKTLSTMDSFHSSQEDTDSEDYEEDSSEFSSEEDEQDQEEDEDDDNDASSEDEGEDDDDDDDDDS